MGITIKEIFSSFKERIHLFWVLGVSLAVVPLSQNCDGIINPTLQENAEVILSTDREEYEPGDEIKISLTVRNIFGESVILTFNDGQLYDFVVKKLPEGKEIWRWSMDKVFAQASQKLPLGHSDIFIYSEIWNQRDNSQAYAKPGLYRIEGYLSSEPEIYAEPLQIKIMDQTYETIDKGFYSGHNKRASYVIKSRDEWSQVWNTHTKIISPQPSLPEVNFSDDMVIAVFRGEFATGGYSTEITRIDALQEKVIITVVENDGDPGAVLDVLTQPYHIVKMRRSEMPIEFVYIHGN